MSLLPSNLGKSLSSPSPSSHSSPIIPTAASTAGSSDHSSRRPNQQTGSGSTAGISAAPRKGQASRKQHRNQKRPGAAGGGAGALGTGGNTGQNKNKNNFRFEDEDDMAEIRALKSASSRRGQTSITHLLNYAAPSRAHLEHAFGGNDHYYGSRSRHHGGHHHHGGGHHSYRSHHHNSTVDKARFVHSNYRFVVTPLGNYAAQATDADEYIDWNDVLQILASTESQNSSCPICLSEPVAPRMAKCGHIFCLPCLIRFMHAIDADESVSNAAARAARTVVGLLPSPNANGGTLATARNANNSAPATPPAPVPEKRAKWKKCPICEESVYLGEVRPVRFYAGQESPLPRPGDDVVLRLMMRHANSTVALPREGAADVLNSGVTKGGRGGGASIPWHFAANVLDYSRIMKGTGDYMVEEFGRELEDLARQEKEDELLFHEDGEWTRRAMRTVRTAQESSKELGGIELALQDGSIFSESNNKPRPKLPVGAEPASPTAPTAPARAAQVRTDDGLSPSLPRPTPASSAASAAAAAAAQQDFYFYMSPPHLYLSPLDIRILKTKYGSFSAFPSTLLPRVEHISTGHVVDDAMRRRAKYLGHLPAGCVVSFLECDWTDIVPAETLATFSEDIERRRKRNRDKAFQEERERLQAERLEAAALHRSGARRIGGGGSGTGHDVGDLHHGHDDIYNDTVRPMDINEFQPLGAGSGGDDGAGLTSSSASPPNPRVGFGQLASISTTPPSSSTGGGGGATSRTVWGTRAVPISPTVQAYMASNAADDGWLKDDQVLGSLLDNSGASDADLVAQMEALGVENAKEAVDSEAADASAAASAAGSPAAGAAGKSKKKKKQKITLMSTGGRRGF